MARVVAPANVGPYDDEEPHSCKYCKKIIVTEAMQLDYGDWSIPIQYSRKEARKAAMDGCVFFGLLLPLFSFKVSWNYLIETARLVLYRTRDISDNSRTNSPEPLRHRIVRFWKSLTRPTPEIYIRAKWKAHEIFIRHLNKDLSSRELSVYVTADDPGAEHFWNRPIKRNIFSEETFVFARDHIASCIHGHVPNGICDPPPDEFAPTRLIRVDIERGAFRLKLQERHGAERIQWACLSYCWGGDQPVKLTLKNRDRLLEGISFSTLPETLQDAITVTSRIGLSFVWIDCLCIIQDDDEDKAREINRMPTIYNGAYVTISASSAPSCFDGFLHGRSLPLQNTPFALNYQSSNGEGGRIIFADNFSPNRYPDPVNLRGWTYQERLLSPRLLDFSTTQLRWRCVGYKDCDGGFRPLERVFPASSYKCIATSDWQPRPESQNPLRMWTEALREYTSRKLSVSGDKLLAISAIAQAISNEQMGRYLAGLWEAVLLHQLEWNCSTPRARPAEYRGPTWSWASVDGVIDMPEGGTLEQESWPGDETDPERGSGSGESGQGEGSRSQDETEEDQESECGDEIEGEQGDMSEGEIEVDQQSGSEDQSLLSSSLQLGPREGPDWLPMIDEVEVIPLHSSAPYGAVKTAYLILTGRLEPATWFYRNHEVLFNGTTSPCGDSSALLPDTLLDEGDTHSTPSIEVWCLAFSSLIMTSGMHAFGLLLEEDKSIGCFRRVGCFKGLHIPEYPDECSRELFGIDNVRTIKII